MDENVNWFLKNALNIVGGVLLTALAYLSEIKGTIHVMWLAMLLDLIVGIRKSYKVDKLRFQMGKFKEWMAFVLIATALVSLVFATEQEMTEVSLNFYNWFSLLIIGFVLSSIIRNAEKLTHKYIFTALLDFINDKVKKFTGVNLKKYDKNE